MPGRRSTALALLVVLSSLAGCTQDHTGLPASLTTPPAFSGTTTDAPGTTTSARPGTAQGRAVVTAPADATTVLDAEPGAASAIATSAALFRSAPVVIAATEADEQVTALATRLGAPVLLTAADPQRTDTALAGELARLGPDAVLAVGTDAADAVREPAGGVPVLTAGGGDERSDVPELPSGLPATTPPDPVDLTMLVAASRDDSAAVASARAAGATVVRVAGSDPRADPKAIAALHERKPAHVLAVGKGFGPAERLRARVTVAAGGAQVPGGGQLPLHDKRIVCLYGHPGTKSLGVLGEQGVDASVARAKGAAAAYRRYSDIPVVPAFEIIATVAQGAPGPDGDFSGEASIGQLKPWVDKARAAGLYVLLDLQPGRADLLAQARRYEPLLRLPNVGLAVDPEWKLGPRQRPLGQIGGMDAAELNRTSAWLASLTAAHALPQKLFVIHQFRLTMIRHEANLDTSRDELTVLIHMDGQGSTAQKNSTWRSVVGARPGPIPLGWKNFYDEDHPMLTPSQTMAKRPAPMMISYQ
jgi:hypothetical protein